MAQSPQPPAPPAPAPTRTRKRGFRKRGSHTRDGSLGVVAAPSPTDDR